MVGIVGCGRQKLMKPKIQLLLELPAKMEKWVFLGDVKLNLPTTLTKMVFELS